MWTRQSRPSTVAILAFQRRDDNPPAPKTRKHRVTRNTTKQQSRTDSPAESTRRLFRTIDASYIPNVRPKLSDQTRTPPLIDEEEVETDEELQPQDQDMATEDRAQHSSVPFTPVETDVSASNRYLTTILDCMRKDAAERDRQWREDARTRDRQLEALLTRFADGQDTANINASMLQQISKQERKEREEKERKRAIPNPQSMKTEDDIADFIEAFKTVHIAKDTPKEAWGVHLLPLLNDQAKAAVSGLPADDKLDYNTLKTNLLASVVETTKHASKTFWELHKKSGHTYRTFVLELKRLSRRFAFAETYEEVSDKFVLEKFLQDLAPEQQAYVRERA